MQFRNVKGAEVSAQSTSIFVFDDLTGCPWVEVKPGGEHNKPYYNAILKRGGALRRQLSSGSVDAAVVERVRQNDRELYPMHILTGKWGGWKNDETGEEIPYSSEAAKELMAQLPIEQFDRLRTYCNESVHFRADAVRPEDIEATSKN